MVDAELSPCAFTQSEERAAVCYTFISFFPHSHCLALATLQHLCHLSRATAPSLFPFVMWKQPFSCGDSLSFHPDAWHSWQIGCGSEGDGLWKQCPCPRYTHEHIYTKATRSTNTKNISRVCVHHLAHNTFRHSAPLWGKAQRLCCKRGDDLDV